MWTKTQETLGIDGVVMNLFYSSFEMGALGSVFMNPNACPITS